jgi:hypothetical protein
MVEGALITNALAYKSSGALQEKTKNTVLHAAAPPLPEPGRLKAGVAQLVRHTRQMNQPKPIPPSA